MTESEFTDIILQNLPHRATDGQRELAKLLSSFIFSPSVEHLNKVFVLKGYAGTGKTSMISSLVKSLPSLGKRTVLLAPTGRAAKVLAQYSGKPASTIHRKIYMQTVLAGGMVKITLRSNPHKNTLFIVDEASMIQGESISDDFQLFSSRNLLDDLMEFVFSSNCRLLLCGDVAQLPPVGLQISPALDLQYLKASYPLAADEFELKEVVRQQKESGILANATLLRNYLGMEQYQPPYFHLVNFPDIVRLHGSEFEEALNQSLHTLGTENTVIITRSNKRANLFNREIRNRILFRDHEINAGDLLMVVRNNYFWLPPESGASFIANGDMIEVLRVRKTEELYGFRFADVLVRLIDYPDEPALDVKILLDTIDSESASLTSDENRKLFESVMQDFTHIVSRNERFQLMRTNPYLNALQVKFAYALTCHKTQGGQWEDVFIEQGYLNDERLNREYLRWLYTAITRASRKVYLLNFEDRLFAD